MAVSISEVMCTDVRSHLHTPIWPGVIVGGRWPLQVACGTGGQSVGCVSRAGVVRTRTTSTVQAGRYRANLLSAFSRRRIQLCFGAKAQLKRSGTCPGSRSGVKAGWLIAGRAEIVAGTVAAQHEGESVQVVV